MRQVVEANVAKVLDGWEEAFGGKAGLLEIVDGKRASPVVLNYVNGTGLSFDARRVKPFSASCWIRASVSSRATTKLRRAPPERGS